MNIDVLLQNLVLGGQHKMALARCVFCGKQQEDYQGTYLIKNDGTMNYYCSSKCRKNHLKLGRDKRKLKWTMAFHESRVKRYASEKREHEEEKKMHERAHAQDLARKDSKESKAEKKEHKDKK